VFRAASKGFYTYPDFLDYLCPGWLKVLDYKVGNSFGEIALTKKANRSATIWVETDAEFATISKKSEGDFEYLLNYQQKEIENFLKSFDVFQWWFDRNKLGELTGYITKNSNKGVGDYVYRVGQKIENIYFLKSGEIELTLRKFKKPMFEVTDEEITNNKNKKMEYQYTFRRTLKPPCIFGVEEMLAGCPTRLFNARCKTGPTKSGGPCTYFELPREKIFVDLLAKNPRFLTTLLQYSCFVNDGLKHAFPNLANLNWLKDQSRLIVTKESPWLMNLLNHEDKNRSRCIAMWMKLYKNHEKISSPGFVEKII
jgi:CRP-like cAMP-binding protein